MKKLIIFIFIVGLSCTAFAQLFMGSISTTDFNQSLTILQDDNTTPINDGWLCQIISSGIDEAINVPNDDATPGGDDALCTGDPGNNFTEFFWDSSWTSINGQHYGKTMFNWAASEQGSEPTANANEQIFIRIFNSDTISNVTKYLDTALYLLPTENGDLFFNTVDHWDYNAGFNWQPIDQVIVENSISPAPGAIVLSETEIIDFVFDGFDPNGNELIYSWKLDDVEVSSSANYSFVTNYDSAGEYNLSLDVTDNFGGVQALRSNSRSSLIYNWTITVTEQDQGIIITELSYATEAGGIWTTIQQTIAENDELSFATTATDPDGNPLEYSWKLDGEELSTTSTYSYSTDFTSAGEYLISLDITDNFATLRSNSHKFSPKNRDAVTFEWSVIVEDVDQPIVVNELSPAEGALTVNEEDIINFSIDAVDPDGNVLEYSWMLDDEEVSLTEAFDFITDEESSGDYQLMLFVSDNFGNSDSAISFSWNIHVNDSMESDINIIPIISKLYANYPNPFNPSTTIRFDVKSNETATLVIYNMRGQVVKKELFTAGAHKLSWQADSYASGMYLYNLSSPSVNSTKKMLLLK